MAVQSGREGSLAALMRAGLVVAPEATFTEALGQIAEGAAHATDSAALVRALDPADGRLATVAVAAPPALAAELEGTRFHADAISPEPLDRLEEAPSAVQRAAERVHATALYLVPVVLGEGITATVELYRARPFGENARAAATLAAAQVALVLRAFGAGGASVLPSFSIEALELAGTALATGSSGGRVAEEVVRLAGSASGAAVVLLWELADDGALSLAATFGLPDAATDLEGARARAVRVLDEASRFELSSDALLPPGIAAAAVMSLGQPTFGALQLFFADTPVLTEPETAALTTFGARAALALRAAARSRELVEELERTRTLLAVVAQATSELSLAHTLETAVERIVELLGVDQVAVYLREGDRLLPAAAKGVAPPHTLLADRLLELSLGPLRTRGIIVAPDIAADPLFATVADAAAEAGIAGVVAVPLIVPDETIGVLAVYPRRHRRLGDHDVSLLGALASQLAVAVQNARLHEQAKKLGSDLQASLESELQSARQLGALYEISRSFAQSLSLDATLDAVTSTVVEALDLGAAVMWMPDERRDQLLARAVHVADPALAEAARTILTQPQPFGARPIRHLFRERQPFRLGSRTQGGMGALLAPFLARGWTAAMVPVATPAEVIGALTLVSFRPGEPITAATIDAARAIAGQAALAIDNARLYQQQKQFADTMQRSLLPRSQPAVAGLEVGDVYESAARVEVGGDVYDFLELGDARLAVVLGDVTGHGTEATADMAMAKFVFRSLAREHPEPADFLSAANEVVVDEIAPAKFITMVYVTIDGRTGDVAAASAGHPPARVVHADGRVEVLDAKGLVLGVDSGQHYQEVRAQLPRGSAVVLYTDGVIEARRNGELFGLERLDSILAEHASASPGALARTIVAECRAFAGGELSDDCAAVVIKRI